MVDNSFLPIFQSGEHAISLDCDEFIAFRVESEMPNQECILRGEDYEETNED